MGLRLKQLQGTCKGVRDDRDLRDHQVGTGEAMNRVSPESSILQAGPVSRVSPHLWSGHWSARGGLRPGKRGPAVGAQPGPAPPLGALLGKVARRPPTHSGCGEGSSPATRFTKFQPRSPPLRLPRMAGAGGAALAPPRAAEEGGSPCQWEGSQPELPLPTRRAGLNAAATSARSSCLAVPTSGTLPAPLPAPTAREAPPVGSAQRPRL